MKCFNCGSECENYLCDNCKNIEALEKVFNDVIGFSTLYCTNPYILEYAANLQPGTMVRDSLEEILSFFDKKDVEGLYVCLHIKSCREGFEKEALHYLELHEYSEFRSQYIIYELLQFYFRDDFESSRKWYEYISNTENLCLELYLNASQYYSLIGDYDIADKLADKALEYCENESANYLYYSVENMTNSLNKQKETINKYRKKPYWPKTEKRRRAVAKFYDERGIKYPRITKKPLKIKECDFAPINECFEEEVNDYCAFWCESPYCVGTVKNIYRIAAVKVRDNSIVDEFQEFVKPWDGMVGKKDAAKKAGVPLKVIEDADDVDLVMNRFFDFVGDDVLVSTDAFGNQAKLITRAARYTGMKEIKNEFIDLLDVAADCDEKYDMENNNREFLIKEFGLIEGRDALNKAKINIDIYNKLKEIM